MKRGDALMTLTLVASLALAVAAVVLTRKSAKPLVVARAHDATSLVDATGVAAKVRRYQRIASGSILADRLLLELVEPERIVALSQHGMAGSSVAHRYGNRPKIEMTGDLEALIRLAPDLLLVNNLTDERRVERLRDTGIVVFELGTMRGLQSLLDDIDKVSTLIGEPERGRALARSTRARMDAVAADIPRADRKTSLYVGMYGTQLYGGTRGTSYHDMLVYAGLIDVAAAQYEDWPSYTAEDLLALDPEIIVTPIDGRAGLCAHPTLRALRACTPRGQVVEVDKRLLMDPSLSMIDSASSIREAVYGRGNNALP